MANTENSADYVENLGDDVEKLGDGVHDDDVGAGVSTEEDSHSVNRTLDFLETSAQARAGINMNDEEENEEEEEPADSKVAKKMGREKTHP